MISQVDQELKIFTDLQSLCNSMDPTSIVEGKLYKKATKSIKATIKQSLAIPTSIRSELLPDGNLLILDLLAFPLPNEPALTTKHGLTATSFFSQSPSDSTPLPQLLTKLHHLPILAQKLIQTVVSNAKQLIMDGAQSVIYVHISTGAMTKFPLWVVMFWEEVRWLMHKSNQRIPGLRQRHGWIRS